MNEGSVTISPQVSAQIANMGDHRNTRDSGAMAWADLMGQAAEHGIPPDNVDKEMLEHVISPEKVKDFLDQCRNIAAEVNASKSCSSEGGDEKCIRKS